MYVQYKGKYIPVYDDVAEQPFATRAKVSGTVEGNINGLSTKNFTV